MIIPKAISIVKYLANKFGGKWKYDGHGCWSCKDGVRIVRRVCHCFPDDNDCTCGGTLWLYSNNGDNPVRVYG